MKRSREAAPPCNGQGRAGSGGGGLNAGTQGQVKFAFEHGMARWRRSGLNRRIGVVTCLVEGIWERGPQGPVSAGAQTVYEARGKAGECLERRPSRLLALGPTRIRQCELSRLEALARSPGGAGRQEGAESSNLRALCGKAEDLAGEGIPAVGLKPAQAWRRSLARHGLGTETSPCVVVGWLVRTCRGG